MNFVASQYEKTIPSKSSITPSDRQLEYADGDTLRFEIPSFQAHIDPRQTYLKFRVKVRDAPTAVAFSKKCGIHSLIDNLRIYDADTNLLLENIQNYGELAEKLHIYSENMSIRNKRGLTELLEYGGRAFDGEDYDNLPARNADQSQLFKTYLTGSDATYTSSIDYTASGVECVVAFRLYSGVLGQLSSKMFPSFIVGGLRVEIDLNTASKALGVWTAEGITADDGTVDTSIGAGDSCPFGIVAPVPTTASPLTSVELYCEKNAGFNQVTTDAGGGAFPASTAALTAGGRAVKNQLVGAVNLVVGQKLYGFTNAAAPTTPVLLGTISSVSCNAGENAGGRVRVLVGLTGSTVNGDTFVGGMGNDSAGTAQDTRNNTCFVRRTDAFAKTPRVILNNVEFVVKTAMPPQAYTERLMKQSQTAEGMRLDYLTFDTYRNNINASERVVQINIPAINRRATSILSLPVQNNVANSVAHNNLDSVIDTAKDYNYLVNNKLQPTRKVPLGLLSQTPPKTEQIALFETEKALGAVKIMVKQLDYQDENFFIARALARYGTIYNLAEDGNISLRVEYDAPVLNKLMISYIGGLRRLIVNSSGKYIEP
tara:strand:+ start:4440 stop:6233 length:1794 start_codon:yes stop_codon:yes gene_type:complete